MNWYFLENKVEVKIGNITAETTDAIVNAANSTLLGGGGVDGAIHSKGGKQILEECRKIRETEYPKGLPTGKAVITGGGDLPARFVIHTVGPVYGMNGDLEEKLLADSYTNSLLIAVQNNLKTVAFPSISTGAFHFPKYRAARVSSRAIRAFFSEKTSVEKINLVFFSKKDAEIFVKHQEF
ncbi:MAG: O-acetyl-ADP-ribose deacetylase [Pyrinomonadaceae bacterium]